MGFAFGFIQAGKLIAIRSIGDSVHSSLKNYYFGQSSIIVGLIACAYMDPNFYKPWLIGTSEYPLDGHSIIFCFLSGICGWA